VLPRPGSYRAAPLPPSGGLPRATFALLAQLPVFATLIGAVVLRQIPTAADLAGIALVVVGVALHRGPAQEH
jgi:inner membrane transporter RhtA